MHIHENTKTFLVFSIKKIRVNQYEIKFGILMRKEDGTISWHYDNVPIKPIIQWLVPMNFRW